MREDPMDRSHQSPSLLRMFVSFIRLGVTAFGGPAMVAYVRKMVINREKWIDEDSFQNGVALCQVIPGATVMQMTAYIGLKVRGVAGAVTSYVGFGLPAFLLMMVFSILYKYTHSLPGVVSIFSGLQAIIVAVVANATVSFGKTSLKSWKNILIALIAAGLFGLKANPILIILLAALLGLLSNIRQPTLLRVEHPVKMPPTTVHFFSFLLVGVASLVFLFFFQKNLFDLALLMSKIDLLAFGGGFASVPLMFHEFVEIRSWVDGPTFLNGMVLGQFTPGPIVITATFVGYVVHSLPGAFIATLAMFLPSFLVVIGIAPWFDRLRTFPYFTRAVGGILCSFVGLLLTVTIRFALNVHWDLAHSLLATAGFGALLLNFDILWVVLAGTIISVFAC